MARSFAADAAHIVEGMARRAVAKAAQAGATRGETAYAVDQGSLVCVATWERSPRHAVSLAWGLRPGGERLTEEAALAQVEYRLSRAPTRRTLDGP